MKRILLESRTLAYFAAVCHDRNLSVTAERLQLAKSVLSEACTQVEHELGLSLFERRAQGMQPNEQGLFLAKYVLFMQNIEQFALRVRDYPLNTLSYLNLKLPDRFWSAGINSTLAHTLQVCGQQHPECLIVPELLGQDNLEEQIRHEGSQSHWQERQWFPSWSRSGELQLALYSDAELPKDQEVLVSAPWYFLSPKNAGYWPEQMSLHDLKQFKLTLPHMPWPLSQQAANFCLQEHLGFEQVSDDAATMLNQAQNQRGQVCMLINGLLMTPREMERWNCAVLDIPLTMNLALRTSGTHPLLHSFRQAFQQAWENRNAAPPRWQPETRLRQWRYFGETLEKGSISEAAKNLFLSQPALSMQLKQFEENLQVRLIDRKTGSRQLKLTEPGEITRQLHDGLVDQTRVMEEYSRQQRLNNSQRLFLGILPSIDPHSPFLQLILEQAHVWLQQNHPTMRLEIIEEKHQYLMNALRQQTLHLAVTEADSPWVIQNPIATPEAMGLVIATDLLPNPAPSSLDWHELQAFPLILARRGSGMRSLIDNHCLSLGVNLEAAMESDSLNLNRAYIQQGQYGSILPRSSVASLFDNPEKPVAFIPLRPTLEHVLRLTYLKHRRLSAVEEGLIDYLVTQAS